MSLSESLFGDVGTSPVLRPPHLIAPERTIEDQLAEALDGLYIVQDNQRVSQEIRGRTATAVVFRGRLLQDAETAYPIVTERFKALGFTPLMERRDDKDIIIAIEGLITPRTVSSPVWLHVALLVATIITTTLSGAQFQGYRVNVILSRIFGGDIAYLGTVIGAGAPFALTLLLILGVHEMGHYIAARRNGVSVTLPYFIPFPFIGLLGTLGAVIFIKSPLTSRKSLFDVGISGPLAGFVVALIAFIVGLFLLPSDRPNLLFMSAFGGERLGMPLLLQGIGEVLRPDVANLSRFVARQPVALAAWFGMLLTVLNLLPIGQLDGGHVMYTLFGRSAWGIAAAVFIALIVLGMTVFPSLIFFAFLALMTGLRHPPPGNDITPLDGPRKLLGYATIVLFFLIATPTPFMFGPR